MCLVRIWNKRKNRFETTLLVNLISASNKNLAIMWQRTGVRVVLLAIIRPFVFDA
jgi:hypothetical protein